MTNNLETQTIDVIRCSNLEDFQNQILSIYDQIEEKGFVVLQGWDASDETFQEITQYFGHIQDHHNADDSGLVKLRSTRPITPESVYERFPGQTTDRLLPHTDGPYLDGFSVVNGKVVRISPPSFVILQCIRPAEQGGVSFWVDTQEILQKLWDEEPEYAKVVTQPRTVSYCAAQHFSNYCPLFEQISNETWQVRLRADLMYIEPWAHASVKHVVQNYLFNPKYRQYHYLDEGQIIIIDNSRLLHGRDLIESSKPDQPRVLNKAWLWNNSTGNLLPFKDLPPDPNTFKAYEMHLPLNIDVPNKVLRPIRTGIKLKSHTNRI